MHERLEYAWPKPRVIVLSFPHNPTTACVDLDFMQRVVDFAREHDVVVVHDIAYADLGFDGYAASVDPAGRGRQGVRRRALLDDQVVLDGRLAGGVHASATPRSSRALAKLKSYLDYGTFQPIQIAATVTLNEAADYPTRGLRDLPAGATSSATGSTGIGWPIDAAAGTMFVWAPIPEPYRRWARSSSRCCSCRRRTSRCRRASGFGPGGDGHVRFALIENEQRIRQATRAIRRFLQ